MKSRSGHNRAICAGDQGRFGSDRQSHAGIKARISTWSTDFLTKFIFKQATSGPWRQAASEVLEARLLPKTKKDHTQRHRAPKTSGHRATKPVASVEPGAAAHSTVGP